MYLLRKIDVVQNSPQSCKKIIIATYLGYFCKNGCHKYRSKLPNLVTLATSTTTTTAAVTFTLLLPLPTLSLSLSFVLSISLLFPTSFIHFFQTFMLNNNSFSARDSVTCQFASFVVSLKRRRVNWPILDSPNRRKRNSCKRCPTSWFLTLSSCGLLSWDRCS